MSEPEIFYTEKVRTYKKHDFLRMITTGLCLCTTIILLVALIEGIKLKQVLMIEIIPNMNSLVLHINSSLPIYTKKVEELPVKDFMGNLTVGVDNIRNMTNMAYRIYRMFVSN